MYSPYQPLISAIKKGELEVIKEFIKQNNNNINLKIDEVGNTLLHLVAQANQPDIVHFLLCQENIDIEAMNHDDNTPFQCSIICYEKHIKELEKAYELQLALLDRNGVPKNGKEQEYTMVVDYIHTCEIQLININKIKCLLVAALKIQNNQSEFTSLVSNNANEEVIMNEQASQDSLNVIESDDEMKTGYKGEYEESVENLNGPEGFDSEDEYRQRMYDLLTFMTGYPGFTSVVTELKKNNNDVKAITQIAHKFNKKRSDVEAWKNRSRTDKHSDPKAKLVLEFTELFTGYHENSFKEEAFLDPLEDILIQLEFIQFNSEGVQK